MRSRRWPVMIALAFAALTTRAAHAQRVVVERGRLTGVGSIWDNYTRVLQLTGAAPLSSRLLRPLRDPVAATPADTDAWRSPWSAHFAASRDSAGARVRITILDAAVQSAYNSAVPSGGNDGALWAGRGASTLLTAGARVQAGMVTAQVAPQFTWSENRPFALGALDAPLPLTSPYADVWESARIDRPQRFGDRAVSRGDAGDSFVRVDYGGVFAGVSNEAMWWGPGVDNALLMTNNAPGLAHAFLGTESRDIKIGRIEALWSVGRLAASNYFRLAGDTTPSRRWTNSLLLVFEPGGMPGMYFGFGRVFYAYDSKDPISARELLTLFQPFKKEALASASNPAGNDSRDQMLSVFARWAFPQSGFEVYGEFGRNDHSWDLRDLILEPDHSRAYVIGAQKVRRAGSGLLVFRAEATSLAQTKTSIVRLIPTWYAHHIVRQGYTQRGQVIGAGIGPGSDAQSFTVDWMVPRGRLGLMLRRQRENSDAFYRKYAINGRGYNSLHDVTTSVGPSITAFLGGALVQLSLAREHEYNRYTVERNDKLNAHAELRVEWLPVRNKR